MKITIEDIPGQDEPEIIEDAKEFVLLANMSDKVACRTIAGDVFLGFAAFKLSLIAEKSINEDD